MTAAERESLRTYVDQLGDKLDYLDLELAGLTLERDRVIRIRGEIYDIYESAEQALTAAEAEAEMALGV